MKKLFFLFLALVATTSLWAHDFSVGGIYYNYLDGNNVEVTYRGDDYVSYDEYYGAVTIPASVTYNGTTYSVTSIGSEAFRDCSSLTSIVIPNSVTSIGDYAFYWCSSLTSVTIPNSVTSIGSNAFYHCPSLTSITIPNSVTSIGNSAFSGCSSLTSITIPNSVTSIGDYAFSGCSFTTPVYNAHCFAYMPTSFKGAYTIPDSIKQIAGGAFAGCSSLTSITIPNSVTSIGSGAFKSCSSLTSVTIPNSVTSIGVSAFRGCSSLTSITIPNSVTSIGDYAFSGCSSLTSITIPNSVTSIGEWAFSYCSSLTSITIPNSVTSIGKWAFQSCSSLTSITIPNSVTSIGSSAFSNCSSLTSITCEATTPPTLGSNVFYGVSTSIPVYVPCGSENIYKAASGWKEFTKIQEPQVEYAIQVSASNSQMGTAIVNYNSCAGNQISATANIGYHFVQWSDGNTDNPRTIVLTQDTTLTAEFAPNTYTITTVSSDTLRGTTQGDTTVNYLDIVTICANASYGYHFTQWNDGNVENPRQVQVTGDATYTATFDKNTYAISLSCNEEQGSVEGVTSAEYLDTVTISATANIGYHFVQWSDGNTDNPRTLTLTQDTVLTAEFAQTYSGKCGDNLYWKYDDEARQLTISGFGEMYNYTTSTQPWVIFKRRFVTLSLSDEITKIGEYAFDGCVRIREITLGSKMEELADYSFTNCSSLQDIYCYAQRPPYEDSFLFVDNHYAITVHVPCDYLTEYQMDYIWQNFPIYECISSNHVETDSVVVSPGSTDVTITWPTEEGADTYTIVIKKDGEVVCTLTFNAEGQLLNIAFAPGRDGNHPAQYAEAVANGGYRFTVTGLEEGTHYTYNIDVKNTANQTINSHSGAFTTQSTTAVENTHSQSPMTNCQKIFRNGQLIILRDGVEYNAMGAQIQ